MSRIALIDKHDGVLSVVYHSDDATDAAILRRAVSDHKAHTIKRITICQSGIVIDNTTALEIAIATTERLTA